MCTGGKSHARLRAPYSVTALLFLGCPGVYLRQCWVCLYCALLSNFMPEKEDSSSVCTRVLPYLLLGLTYIMPIFSP